MKQSFLDSLKSQPEKEATELVQQAGHKPWVISPDVDAITSIARPNTVVLWLDANGFVRIAEAGDPLELV